jgi:NAD(P)-dependent dehydrogenase (short-subunit alcohol dehydrogenase family)
MDHTRISTVIAAAKDFLSRETLLHGLVNNAGVLAVPLEMTGDGYDLTWQVNYLAHCVFTHQLLPLMLETSKGLPAGAVRVVNITSGGHLMAPKMGINFEDTSLRGFSTVNRYGQSKLANILHAKQLHKLHGPSPQRTRSVDGEIWTSAVHPGIVQSDLDDRAVEMPWYMRAASNIAQWTGGRWPTDKGAWTQVFCVASPDMEASQSGTLFERIAKPASMESSKAKNMELAAKLEDWTTKEMKKHGWA